MTMPTKFLLISSTRLSFDLLDILTSHDNFMLSHSPMSPPACTLHGFHSTQIHVKTLSLRACKSSTPMAPI